MHVCTAGPCGCIVEGWPYSLVKECPLVCGWHLGLLNYQRSKFLLCCFSHKPCDVLSPQCELRDVTGILSLCLCVGCSSLCGDKVPEEGNLGKEELIWPMTEVEGRWQEPRLTDHTVSAVGRDAGRGACLLWLSGSSKIPLPEHSISFQNGITAGTWCSVDYSSHIQITEALPLSLSFSQAAQFPNTNC